MKFRWLPGGSAFLAAGLANVVALAEGSAEVGANQRLQAAENRTIGTNTLRLGRLGADVLNFNTENITWTGTGALRIWAPSANPDVDPPTATLNSGQTHDTTQNGAYILEPQQAQTGAWSVSVSGTAVGFGRVFSTAWQFFTNSFGSGAATSASFYALVPAGESDKTGVIELKLNGMSGNRYVIAANQRGVDGAIAGRSVPEAGNGFTPQYKIYLNPPEVATFDPVTPVASALDFSGGPLGCDEIGTGVSTGTFEFTSNITGTYHLVCDLNKDSIYNRVGSEDFLYVGLATPGTNTATWNGLDNAGNPVPSGTYDCKVFLNTGEMHYVAWDVETAYQGLRMFEVASNLSRVGLDGFWNDFDVQANSNTMPNGDIGSQDSGSLGVNAGLYAAAAVADGETNSGNAHAWGNYTSGGKGNDALVDTFAFLRSTATGLVNVTTVDPNLDTDGDTLPDYHESCDVGTDPTLPDTDGDGISDGGESGGGSAVDTDGDGVIDALDADSDNDGTTDANEGAADSDGDGVADVLDLDSDGDGIPDIDEAQMGELDADGDGRVDDMADDDGDGLANVVDSDPNDPAVVTSLGGAVNTDGLADGDDRIDLDSDEDGLSDVVEGGGVDSDADGLFDATADSNGDGLDDALEPGGALGPLPLPNSDGQGAPDFQQADADGDGVDDGADSDPSDPLLCSDTDSDSCEDCLTGTYDPLSDGPDTDLDGQCNLTDPDDDGDGVPDLTDSDPTDPLVCADADADGCDECQAGTVAATGADGLDTDGDGLCDTGDPDDDGDDVPDGQDTTPLDGVKCQDTDNDGCDDCVSGSADAANDGTDSDGDGLCNTGDPDDDGDGVPDGQDSAPQDPSRCRDEDGDGCEDCLSGTADPAKDGPDQDSDGLCDAGETSTGSDPNDKDSDDDGVPDADEPDGAKDTDGDGLINRNDPDSDNDGLSDGTELGLDCDGKGTDVARGFCIPDADLGKTVTDPLDADTDGGGVRDGSEDANLNGARDSGETSPIDGAGADDKDADADDDGLSDDLEEFLGSDPNDADTDNDGVPDGDEPNPSLDMDGDELIDVLDVDSDNDGLFDGTEMGRDCSASGTDSSLGHCRADSDPSTQTSPLDADTDDGGATDGSEDANLNGAVDSGETDPVLGQGADDGDALDTDDDGLSDELEEFLGTDPEDADSDDDGLPDGQEPNPSDDHDGDGAPNALDPDSDGDGLFDGTEAGNDCSAEDIDLSLEQCVADGDDGETVTGILNPDTDRGGVSDGDEDANHNGVVDGEETDPNRREDDISCAAGADGCAAGGAGGQGPTESGPRTAVVRGGGLTCSTGEHPQPGAAWPWLLAFGLLGAASRRRRAS